MLPGRHARLSLLTRFSRIYLPPRLWVAAQPGKHRTVEDDSDFYCVGHLGVHKLVPCFNDPAQLELKTPVKTQQHSSY